MHALTNLIAYRRNVLPFRPWLPGSLWSDQSPAIATALPNSRCARMNDQSTVLVTGSDGFIGRHLVPYLGARGYKVIAASRTTSPLRDLTSSRFRFRICPSHSTGRKGEFCHRPQDLAPADSTAVWRIDGSTIGAVDSKLLLRRRDGPHQSPRAWRNVYRIESDAAHCFRGHCTLPHQLGQITIADSHTRKMA